VEKKDFQKIQDSCLNCFFHFSRHLGFLNKLLFHNICVLPTPNEFKKKIKGKKVKKSDFDPPFWIEPLFLTHCQKILLIDFADKNTNTL
jgi:hypothetical protein